MERDNDAAGERMYHNLAQWWPLLSPPSEYEEEAADLLGRLPTPSGSSPLTLLELGSGGGSLAFHLKRRFRLTLTDLSPAMLAVSRLVNPECEHQGFDFRAILKPEVSSHVPQHQATAKSWPCADGPGAA